MKITHSMCNLLVTSRLRDLYLPLYLCPTFLPPTFHYISLPRPPVGSTAAPAPPGEEGGGVPSADAEDVAAEWPVMSLARNTEDMQVSLRWACCASEAFFALIYDTVAHVLFHHGNLPHIFPTPT